MRIGCVVPFCKRTRGDRKGDPVRAGMEWICAQHWRHVSKATKRRKRLAENAYERATAEVETIGREGDRCAREHGGVHYEILGRFSKASDKRDKARARCCRAWARCKKLAIEAAAGIG